MSESVDSSLPLFRPLGPARPCRVVTTIDFVYVATSQFAPFASRVSYICNRAGARVHAYAARGAVIGAEGFFVSRFIASCNSSTSKGFARNMSTFNSS